MRWLIAEAGLLDFFDPALLLFSSVEGIDKRQQQFFGLASQRAGVPAERCVYVSEDDAERRVAALAKLRTSYHPLHVFHVIDLMAQGLTGSARIRRIVVDGGSSHGISEGASSIQLEDR